MREGGRTQRKKVAREIPNILQVEATAGGSPSERARTRASFLASARAFGRPPTRPQARAEVNRALVGSRIRSRSHSAGAPKTWKIGFPPGVVVSICAMSDSKPIPRSASSATVSTRCLWKRPERSRRQPTNLPLPARDHSPGHHARSSRSSTGANASISARLFGDSQTCTSSIPA